MDHTNPNNILDDDFRQIAVAIGDRVDRLEGSRLLLTGASGLLAGYMARSLLWLNQEVLKSPCQLVALVRRPVRPESLLGQVGERPDLQILIQDVTEPINIGGPLDFIIHAASQASPRDYLQDPLGTIDANVSATRSLLELARLKKAQGFLFFSSGEIYGDVPGKDQPIQEIYKGADSPIGPRACYTESKRMGETLAVTYHREFGVPANVVRPFQVYGPGLDLNDGRVIPDFLRSRLFGDPIHLLSDGSAVRTFCYASDGVAGFWAALLADEYGLSVNIGDDKEAVSVLELAEIVASLEQPRLDVVREVLEQPEYLRGNPSMASPDLSVAREVFEYEPRTSLSDGLLRTLQWLRDQNGD